MTRAEENSAALQWLPEQLERAILQAGFIQSL